jgi:argininosuccinate lyase
MNAKLWQKGLALATDANIFCTFTTGNDYQLDHTYFLEHDLKASMAWAKALCKAGIYTESELDTVLEALATIKRNYNRGSFGVTQNDEDSHTAIENALVNIAGEPGKKIHTGRSRNDQALTAIRLFMKQSLERIHGKCLEFKDTLLKSANAYGGSLFIGYSHTQQAMPTTVEHYFMAHAESISDDVKCIETAMPLISQCPLGTGSGFGSPLDIDRDFLTAELGLSFTQVNSLYCQNSRGKFELLFVNSLTQIMLSLQRLAGDMVLYTSREFSLFKMSDSLAQGSSMMPHKKNPDVFELVRAKSADVMALEERIKMIVKGLPSGYNRDLQEIKACIVDAYNITNNCLDVMNLAMKHIEPDTKNIERRIQRDIVITDIAISKCISDKKLNFRDVYKKIDLQENIDPLQAALARRSTGSPGNLI